MHTWKSTHIQKRKRNGVKSIAKLCLVDGGNLLLQDRIPNLEMWGRIFLLLKELCVSWECCYKETEMQLFWIVLCSGIFRTPYKHLPGGAHCTWLARVNQAVHSKCSWQLDEMSGLVDVRKSPGAEARYSCISSLCRDSFFILLSHPKLKIFLLLTLDNCQDSSFCPDSLLGSRLLEFNNKQGSCLWGCVQK